MKPTTLLAVLMLLIGISSCSNLKKINRQRHNLEDHGYVVIEKDSLPSTCAEKYPCVTTSKEVSDSGWIVFGTDNQAVVDSLKQIIDSMRAIAVNAPPVTDYETCLSAVRYYQGKVTEYTSEISRLTAQVKNSSTEYRQRTETLTIESTAKLAAKDLVIAAYDKQNKAVQASLDSATLLIQQAHAAMKEHMAGHDNIGTTFFWFIGAIWAQFKWWIIIAAVAFGLYRFRKFLPLLKLIP